MHIDFNCSHVVVQYNLSTNNSCVFCERLGNNFNNAYRYNISVNGGYKVKGIDGKSKAVLGKQYLADTANYAVIKNVVFENNLHLK